MVESHAHMLASWSKGISPSNFLRNITLSDLHNRMTS